MTADFKDHFSSDSGAYAAYRPHYPERLFSHLADLCLARELAWDCATGNGQAALGLSNHFSRVLATDASRSQIANAVPHERVEYRVAQAEWPPMAESSLDLVTVAQALHWFDTARFFREVERVLKPGGIVAAWSYNLFRSIQPVDEIVDHLYHDVLGVYWPPERRLVEEGYRSLEFPFVELTPLQCDMEAEQNLGQILNYLGTWSAVRRYIEDRGEDPLKAVRDAFAAAELDPRKKIPVRWPLQMRIGRKPAKEQS